jgi:signal transduction histidine kinase
MRLASGVPQSVVSDERRFKQVIINLLSNALKFTNEGSITIEVEFDADNKKLYFNIIDTGIGIRKADQVKLFKMFGKLKSSQ